jgi:hypothetical protein
MPILFETAKTNPVLAVFLLIIRVKPAQTIHIYRVLYLSRKLQIYNTEMPGEETEMPTAHADVSM